MRIFDIVITTFTIKNVLAILFLVLIEGLLSFDNSIALAALVKKKLKNSRDQKKALLYGIWGAYVFRILTIFCGVWLMSFWYIKLLAGIYLVQLCVRELWIGTHKKAKKQKVFNIKWLTPFWTTVISIELMDIAFSIDSIGVALAISNVKGVLILGAIFGILTMRLAANVFIDLIDKYPILEKTAFLLVGIAGIGVCLKAFNMEIPEVPFISTLFGILISSVYYNHNHPKKVEMFLKRYYS